MTLATHLATTPASEIPVARFLFFSAKSVCQKVS